MRLRLDAERCTGHGRCYDVAPGLFAPDDDGYGTVLQAEVPAADEDLARRAVTNCPERAIALDD